MCSLCHLPGPRVPCAIGSMCSLCHLPGPRVPCARIHVFPVPSARTQSAMCYKVLFPVPSARLCVPCAREGFHVPCVTHVRLNVPFAKYRVPGSVFHEICDRVCTLCSQCIHTYFQDCELSPSLHHLRHMWWWGAQSLWSQQRSRQLPSPLSNWSHSTL